MSDYDFRQLNDKEFEILCSDILGIVTGNRIERFKAGRDFGVDGRYFSSRNEEVILQCKHWANTPTSSLIRALAKDELPKLNKLKPKKYYLAVSSPLSRADKRKIFNALSPHVISESDVLGKEDINDLIKKHPEVERRNYKLWLHSASVLSHVFSSAIIGRSAFSLEEIIRNSSRYAVTQNHESALRMLDRLGVVIISGEPGVGKTTLADHLCLHYVADGFSYYKIDDEIREAESIFEADQKQIFYFDDFLGRNYLDALRGHEGSQITQFIRRVATNKNKKFVLTSRSTILNQGKLFIDSFEHNNLQRNEYELRIANLSEIDRARILYNHIWHSGLDREYVEQLYIERRYRLVISHRNFNPRIISYITDPTRLESCSPPDYWQYILDSLTNPAQIWDNPFVAQLDDFGRSIVILVVLNGHAIDEQTLSEAYQRYLMILDNRNFQGKREFLTNMRHLTGSFLSRVVSTIGITTVDLFNPSIGDYVLQRYSKDISTLRNAFLSLRTPQSISVLRSLVNTTTLSVKEAASICRALLKDLASNNFEGSRIAYLSQLCASYVDWLEPHEKASDEFFKAAIFLLNEGYGEATDDSFEVICWALENSLISPDDCITFLDENIHVVTTDDEISAAYSLLRAIPEETSRHTQLKTALGDHVFEVISENINDFIEADRAYSRADYGDYQTASRELERLVEEKLDDLGVLFDPIDVESIIEAVDVPYELASFYENAYDGEDRDLSVPIERSLDEIDDLFDRG